MEEERGLFPNTPLLRHSSTPMFAHFLHSLPRENRPNRYDSQRKMTTDDFRILIAATEKTGNTWLKLLLSQIYDLPTPYIGQDFSEAEADSLGTRW